MTDRSKAAAPGTPLYLHLPFCAAKCTYCDFYSLPAAGQDVEGTLEAILEEIRHRAPDAPRTVYLGGGTPSLLSSPQLRRLLEELQRVTGFRDSAVEVTAECNPESLDVEKARTLLELGVDRLSIGFQSLHEEVLHLFGRVHSVEQSFRAYGAAREAGVENLGVDLLFAVPGQSPEQWGADLDRVLALGPDHLSAYNLTFEEKTLLQRWLDQGRVARQPEELELECLLATRARLAEAGLEAYEVSNFATSSCHCQHNINYWRNGPYAGIGPSAVSHLDGRRAGNVRPLGVYRRRIAAGGEAEAWSEELDPRARLGETWWLGLRLAEGLDPDEARLTAGCSLETSQEFTQLALQHTEGGHLESVGPRFRLTRQGLPVADAVARTFLRLSDDHKAPKSAGATPRSPTAGMASPASR